jgi:hypothetical protein
LRDRFGSVMAKSAYAEGFRLITSPDSAGNSDDPRERARQIADIADLKSFAAELRKNLARDTTASAAATN